MFLIFGFYRFYRFYNIYYKNIHKNIIYLYGIIYYTIIKIEMEMDFSGETPEEKKLRLGGVVKVIGKVIPAIAPFVPALQPVAAVIGALKK
jgi:hypothetical protein